MITKKAAIGFILLAIIVFPTAYFSWTSPIAANAKNITFQENHILDHSSTSKMVYRPPLMTFKTPLDMAVACTVIIEVFTLICYLVLKRIEPAIKEWERVERERVLEEAAEENI